MYNALDVAHYIIKRCNDTGQLVSNLKLQKILYFVQAEFLVATGDACYREQIEAWDFGPVVPEVYRRYKSYGSAGIPYYCNDSMIPISNIDQELMNAIIDKCAGYSASQLVEISHHQDPWRDAYKPYRNCPISNDSIKRYFTEK